MLWNGNWITRARIMSGLILLTYAFFHFLNLGLGLVSTEAMETMQAARQVITRNPLGAVILIGALLVHPGLALWQLAQRRSLRMPLSEAFQTLLGLLIPLQLLPHIAHTTIAHQYFAVNDDYPYIIVLMWNAPVVWWQSALLLAVWVHGCMGLHFWLRLTTWWHRALPYMIGLAVFIPSFALAGLLTEGRRIYDIFVEGSQRAALMASYNWPSRESFDTLRLIESRMVQIFVLLVALTALSYGAKKLLRRRRSVRITYRNGPAVTAEKGMTLLKCRVPMPSRIRRFVVARGAAPPVASSSKREPQPCRQQVMPRPAAWRRSTRRRTCALPVKFALFPTWRSAACSAPTVKKAGHMPARERNTSSPSCFWICAALPPAPRVSCPMMWFSC